MHVIHTFTYADEIERSAATFATTDVGKVALQSDNKSFWLLTQDSPALWAPLGSGSASSGGADTRASYLVLNITSSLANERVLSVSGSSGLRLVDLGANGQAQLSINDNVVATVSGTTFSGPVVVSAAGLTGSLTGSFKGTLSGSLTTLESGLPYLLSQGSITLTTMSNGQVIISGSGGGSGVSGAPTTAAYVTLATDSTLTNERVLVVGDGLFLNDGGANGNVTLINTKPGEISASYLVVATTGSLPNERALAAASGITLTDGGSGGNVTVGINDNIVATVALCQHRLVSAVLCNRSVLGFLICLLDLAYSLSLNQTDKSL
jgi:hypothetical protein